MNDIMLIAPATSTGEAFESNVLRIFIELSPLVCSDKPPSGSRAPAWHH
jgi:hypothetical protein